MIGVLGLALLCASVLLLFFVARLRNSQNPPHWSRWGVTVHSTLVVFLCGSLAGGALVFALFVREGELALGMAELVSALGAAAVTVVLWRLIDRIPKGAEAALPAA